MFFSSGFQNIGICAKITFCPANLKKNFKYLCRISVAAYQLQISVTVAHILRINRVKVLQFYSDNCKTVLQQ
jgi:hypothetical protein